MHRRLFQNTPNICRTLQDCATRRKAPAPEPTNEQLCSLKTGAKMQPESDSRSEHASPPTDVEEVRPHDVPADEPPGRPYVTITIIGLITAIFLAMMAAGHGDVRPVAIQFGAKDNALIYQGQYWRLITPIFLHGDWLHLLVNG